MINLIPPHAKDAVKRQYWIRVLTVWLWLITATLVILAVLQVPTYVLITTLRKASAQESGVQAAERADLAQFEDTITKTNALIAHLKQASDDVSFTKIVNDIDSLTHEGITIQGISLGSGSIEKELMIDIQGHAPSRQALSTFSETVKNHQGVTAVRLPISNLAKDRDIDFTMSVSYMPPTQ